MSPDHSLHVSWFSFFTFIYFVGLGYCHGIFWRSEKNCSCWLILSTMLVLVIVSGLQNGWQVPLSTKHYCYSFLSFFINTPVLSWVVHLEDEILSQSHSLGPMSLNTKIKFSPSKYVMMVIKFLQINTLKSNQNPSSMHCKYTVEQLINDMAELDTVKCVLMI